MRIDQTISKDISRMLSLKKKAKKVVKCTCGDKWKLDPKKKTYEIPRPKGCKSTISGKHIPMSRRIEYTGIVFYCSACGLIDDLGIFQEYLYGKPEKLDDRNI